MGKQKTAARGTAARHGIINRLISMIKHYWILILTLILMAYVRSYWSFLIFIVGFGLWKTWVMWPQIRIGKQYIETMIWGKPLIPELWEKGEMKRHKVKVTYKGKAIGVYYMKISKWMYRVFFLGSLFAFGIFFTDRWTYAAVSGFGLMILAIAFKTWFKLAEIAIKIDLLDHQILNIKGGVSNADTK